MDTGVLTPGGHRNVNNMLITQFNTNLRAAFADSL